MRIGCRLHFFSTFANVTSTHLFQGMLATYIVVARVLTFKYFT